MNTSYVSKRVTATTKISDVPAMCVEIVLVPEDFADRFTERADAEKLLDDAKCCFPTHQVSIVERSSLFSVCATRAENLS
jgi:hypothetical protein